MKSSAYTGSNNIYAQRERVSRQEISAHAMMIARPAEVLITSTREKSHASFLKKTTRTTKSSYLKRYNDYKPITKTCAAAAALNINNKSNGLASEKLSDNEYPIGEVVLGIEIRTHSIKGALIDTANADFIRPGVDVKMEALTEEEIEKALTKIVNHYNWQGTVGISYTRAVTKVGNWGREINKYLTNMLPKSKGKCCSMIHAEAAAYAQMYYGPGRDINGTVLVVTIGKGFGTVVYNQGQKARNMNMIHMTWTYESEARKQQEKYQWQGIAPTLDDKDEETKEQIFKCLTDSGLEGSWEMSFDNKKGGEIKKAVDEFIAWGGLVDEYLQKVTEHVKPERVILLTTGDAARLPTGMLFNLFAPAVASAGVNPKECLIITESPERALVKGAALGAMLELSNKSTVEILRAAICKDVTGAQEPRILTDADMQFVFKKLDRNKDGKLDADDILRGAALYDVALSPVESATVLRAFAGTSAARNNVASFEDFERFWVKTVKKSFVKHVSHQDELEMHLSEKKLPADEAPVIVLQSGYSYCRPCIKFERSYESVAKDPRFKSIKFLKVVGDSSPATSKLTANLGIENTPDFRIFRGGKLVQKFTGANRKKLEDNLVAVLEQDADQIEGILIK